MSILKGIAASSGIAVAKAYLLEQQVNALDKKTVHDVDAELKRFRSAFVKSSKELEEIRAHAMENLGADKAAIFAAHLLVLRDPGTLTPMKDKIKAEQVNAEFSLKETADMFIAMFESMDNEYMRERAADIRD